MSTPVCVVNSRRPSRASSPAEEAMARAPGIRIAVGESPASETQKCIST